MFWYIIGYIVIGFIGARLYFVLTKLDSFIPQGEFNLVEFFKNVINLRQGGLAIYGGIIGHAEKIDTKINIDTAGAEKTLSKIKPVIDKVKEKLDMLRKIDFKPLKTSFGDLWSSHKIGWRCCIIVRRVSEIISSFIKYNNFI